MFGISNIAMRSREDRLLRLLDRRTSIEPLGSLVAALKGIDGKTPLGKTAIGLDANVFLRISGHKQGEDIIDYFGSAHVAPLILPGQAIQEFWNNQLQAVDTVASSIRKKFDTFRGDMSKLDSSYSEFSQAIEQLISGFGEEHGYAYEEATVRKTISFLEVLQRRAIVPYAPRSPLMQIAAHRKRTKTPPGFKDDLDGDFYIWADFLMGLMEARARGVGFDRVVFVTYDQKPDWVRAKVAHPILTAEVHALVGAPFEIWDLEKLTTAIAQAT